MNLTQNVGMEELVQCLEIRSEQTCLRSDMNIYFEKLPHVREPLFGRLLALELGVFGDHIFLPLDLAGGQVPHDLRHVAQRDPNLAGRVPLPE